MSRIDLLSIIRGLDTLFTAIGISHISCDDSLLARSDPSQLPELNLDLRKVWKVAIQHVFQKYKYKPKSYKLLQLS
jgi:hypothetical protein